MEEKDYQPFILALQSDVWFHRQQAIHAIEKLGGDVAVKILMEALKDAHENVRCQAVNALVRLKAKKAIKDIIRCLSDESPKVREESCFALGILQAEDAIPYLIKALGDKVTRVSYAATRALHKLGGSRVLKPMAEVLFQCADTVRIRLVEALGAIEPDTEEDKKVAFNALYKALGDENRLVVIWSAFSLVNMGAPEQIHIIIKEVDNPDNMIRFNAVTALGKLKDKRSLDALKRKLDREFDLRIEQKIREVINMLEKS